MPRRIGGFTLIELMISMAVSLLVIIGVSDILLNALTTQLRLRQTEALLQETTRVSTFIYTELRRAGYMGTTPSFPATAPQRAIFLFPSTSNATCVRFAYDSNRGEEKFFGFRRQGEVLQWYAGANAEPCTSDSTGWLPFTSPLLVRVTSFNVRKFDNGLNFTLTTELPQRGGSLTETHYVMPRNQPTIVTELSTR